MRGSVSPEQDTIKTVRGHVLGHGMFGVNLAITKTLGLLARRANRQMAQFLQEIDYENMDENNK